MPLWAAAPSLWAVFHGEVVHVEEVVVARHAEICTIPSSGRGELGRAGVAVIINLIARYGLGALLAVLFWVGRVVDSFAAGGAVCDGY